MSDAAPLKFVGLPQPVTCMAAPSELSLLGAFVRHYDCVIGHVEGSNEYTVLKGEVSSDNVGEAVALKFRNEDQLQVVLALSILMSQRSGVLTNHEVNVLQAYWANACDD